MKSMRSLLWHSKISSRSTRAKLAILISDWEFYDAPSLSYMFVFQKLNTISAWPSGRWNSLSFCRKKTDILMLNVWDPSCWSNLALLSPYMGGQSWWLLIWSYLWHGKLEHISFMLQYQNIYLLHVYVKEQIFTYRSIFTYCSRINIIPSARAKTSCICFLLLLHSCLLQVEWVWSQMVRLWLFLCWASLK